jgi:hypothetical protein
MLIRVMYKDGRQDRVKKAQLKDLIEHQQIKMFKRFSGWVSVVCDETREKQICTKKYEGRERRKEEEIRNEFLDERSDF